MKTQESPDRAADKLEQIKAHAERCGLSIQGLLLAAGVQPMYFSRWKATGWRPTDETMGRIMAVQPQRKQAR